MPNNIIIYADAGTGDISFLDADAMSMATRDTHFVSSSRRPVSVAYDPVEQVSLPKGIKMKMCSII